MDVESGVRSPENLVCLCSPVTLGSGGQGLEGRAQAADVAPQPPPAVVWFVHTAYPLKLSLSLQIRWSFGTLFT